MGSDVIDYKIFGDDLQYVEVELDPGETVIGEAGAMMYMQDGIEYEAKMGDGSNPNKGFFDKVLDVGKRVLTRESLFLTHYTNRQPGKSQVAFSAPYSGKIIPMDLAKFGGKGHMSKRIPVLCAARGTAINLEFAKRLGTGFFGGEGFILQCLQGDGRAFVQACGGICFKKINHQTLRVDTGSIVAFTEGIYYDVEMCSWIKVNAFLGRRTFFSDSLWSGLCVVAITSIFSVSK